jgi:uncharacterized protein
MRNGSSLVLGVYLAGAIASSSAAESGRLADAMMNRDLAAVDALLLEKADVNAPGTDGTPALDWAIRYNNEDMVKRFIAAGADVNSKTRHGVTPLYLAASNGNVDVIDVLLKAKADPNATDNTGETMLMAAARGGDLKSVAALLAGGAEVDTREPHFEQTALMIAVREDHPDIVKLLVDHRADVNAQTRLGDVPKFRLPSSNAGSHGVGIVRGGWPERGIRNPASGQMTPLLYAARDGHAESAKILVAAGADVEKREANEMTPLIMALANGKFDVARFLIEKKAAINVVDFYGQSPLWAAIDFRDLNLNGDTRDNGVDRDKAFAIIETLLEKGADPNVRVKEVPPYRPWLTPLGSLEWVDFTGQTSFIRAALSGDVEVMKLLLRYHADPSLTTNSNTTALMAAAGINWVVNQTYDEGPEKLLEAVKMCVELGQDANAVNTMGLTAVHGAANRGSDDILKYLVSKGAKLDVADKEGRTPLTWAQGVFLASVTAEPKPTTIALINRLIGHASAEATPDQQAAR